MHILDILHKAKCKLVIFDLDIDTQTVMGNTMFQITSVIFETERRLISERTSEVMQYMKQKGILRTKPPFGYQITIIDCKKQMVENIKEQEIISFIKQLVVVDKDIKISNIVKSLKDNNMSLRNGKLYHEGIRSILARENIR